MTSLRSTKTRSAASGVGSWNGGVPGAIHTPRAFRTFRHRTRVPDSLPAGRCHRDDRDAGGPALGRFPAGGLAAAVIRGRPSSGTAACFPAGEAGRSCVVGWPSAHRHRRAGDRPGRRRARGALEVNCRPINLAIGRLQPIRSASGVAWIADGKERFPEAPVRVTRARLALRFRVESLEIPIAGSVSALSMVGPGGSGIGSDLCEVVRCEWSGPDAKVAMACRQLRGPSARGCSRRTASCRRCTRIGSVAVGGLGAAWDESSYRLAGCRGSVSTRDCRAPTSRVSPVRPMAICGSDTTAV